eukprot:556863-Pyramimonas_sp.AAC.1
MKALSDENAEHVDDPHVTKRSSLCLIDVVNNIASTPSDPLLRGLEEESAAMAGARAPQGHTLSPF